jgi:uncharacterized protein (TIGR02611 family)
MPTAPEESAELDPEAMPEEDKPELLKKLQQRKERHARRGMPARIGVVVLGALLVIAGVFMSGPGIPGPGILVILLGLSFLALEFEKAERLLEKAIVWADRAKDRAENASPRQKVVSAVATVLAIGAFAVAAILWDIPLVPVL